MAKDKRAERTALKVPQIPDELKNILIQAARPPQNVVLEEDARATTLAVFAETIAIGFQVIGMISEHVSTAPYHQMKESRRND